MNLDFFLRCCYGPREHPKEKASEIYLANPPSPEMLSRSENIADLSTASISRATGVEPNKGINDTMVLEMEQMHDFLSDSIIISKDLSKLKPSKGDKENVEFDSGLVTRLALPDETPKSSERSVFTLGNIRPTENEKAKQITQDVILQGKKLILRMKEGENARATTKYDINPAGCIQSKRTAKDGIVYFGPPYKSKCNDIELEAEEMKEGVRFFKIYYSKEDNEYFLKDLGEGPGTFVRVDSRTVLKQGSVITFGQHHLVVNYKLSREVDPEHKIIIQLIEGEKTVAQYEFVKSDSPIIIGRAEGASVQIRNSALSRIQCIIEFVYNKWQVSDGNGKKPSTNGTWLFAETDIKVLNNMAFKAGPYLFKARIYA